MTNSPIINESLSIPIKWKDISKELSFTEAKEFTDGGVT
jgi:hypothetical protein